MLYQNRIETGRRLRCLVAVELKAGPFKPEYAGKMQFYLAVLDDLARIPEEQPSIGIILCRDKNRIIVEYALVVFRSGGSARLGSALRPKDLVMDAAAAAG